MGRRRPCHHELERQPLAQEREAVGAAGQASQHRRSQSGGCGAHRYGERHALGQSVLPNEDPAHLCRR